MRGPTLLPAGRAQADGCAYSASSLFVVVKCVHKCVCTHLSTAPVVKCVHKYWDPARKEAQLCCASQIYRKSGETICAHFSVAANLGRTEMGPTAPLEIPEWSPMVPTAASSKGPLPAKVRGSGAPPVSLFHGNRVICSRQSGIRSW